MLVVVLVVAPVVQNMAWAQLVQWFVNDMIMVHGMAVVVIGDFGNFEKNVECFTVPIVATQS